MNRHKWIHLVVVLVILVATLLPLTGLAEAQGTCPPSGCTHGRDVGRDFFEGVIQRLSDVPTSDFAVDALVEWKPYENTLACWNPLATTRSKSGSCCFNSVCVRHYLNQTMGMEATAETLALSYYDHIRAMLKLENFDREGLRQDLGTWGTCSGQGCDSLLNQWRSLWDEQQSSTVVTVEDPEIAPSYAGMCGSAWYRFNNNRGHCAYLTLNTNKVAYSTNAATWNATLPTTGVYKVEAYIAHHSLINWQCPSRRIDWDTHDARYAIYHAGGKTNVSGDQAPVDNAWLNLGTYTFYAGSTAKVTLTDLNGESHLSHTVSFSAIRFTLIQETDDTITVEDPAIHPSYNNGMCDSAWYRFSNNRGHHAYLTLNTNDPGQSTNWARWQPNIPSGGTYRVKALIAYHPVINWQCPSKLISWDTSDARYIIHHADGEVTVSGDQKPLNNQWLDLGVYHFNAGTDGWVELHDVNGEANLSRTISFSAMRFVLQGQATDETDPWGEITWPVGNPTVRSEGIHLTANAEDDPYGSGIEQVHFWIRYADDPYAASDWYNAGNIASAPYEAQWTPPDGLRSQLIEVGIHVEDNADHYCIDPSPEHDYECNDKSSKQIFIYNQAGILEYWIPADLRAYLNQRSLVNGDEKCGAASAAMMLAMNGIITSDYDAMAAIADDLYRNAGEDLRASTYASLLNSQYHLGATDKTYALWNSKDDLWGDVTNSIIAHHPVMLLSRQFTDGGHYVVIVGYRKRGGVREFIVYDPYGRWLGTRGENNYDRNTVRNDDPDNPDTSRYSVKGRWVWYKLDDIWPSIWKFRTRKPYLIISESVLNSAAVNVAEQTPDSPPDEISIEDADIGTYEGVSISTDIYLPLVMRQ